MVSPILRSPVHPHPKIGGEPQAPQQDQHGHQELALRKTLVGRGRDERRDDEPDAPRDIRDAVVFLQGRDGKRHEHVRKNDDRGHDKCRREMSHHQRSFCTKRAILRRYGSFCNTPPMS